MISRSPITEKHTFPRLGNTNHAEAESIEAANPVH